MLGKNVINLQELGLEYTVLDVNGREVDTIRIIEHEEILNCGPGRFVEYHSDDLQEYMEDFVLGFEGFVADSTDISWYYAESPNYEVMNAVVTALQENNNIVIIEYADSIGDIHL